MQEAKKTLASETKTTQKPEKVPQPTKSRNYEIASNPTIDSTKYEESKEKPRRSLE